MHLTSGQVLDFLSLSLTSRLCGTEAAKGDISRAPLTCVTFGLMEVPVSEVTSILPGFDSHFLAAVSTLSGMVAVKRQTCGRGRAGESLLALSLFGANTRLFCFFEAFFTPAAALMASSWSVKPLDKSLSASSSATKTTWSGRGTAAHNSQG